MDKTLNNTTTNQAKEQISDLQVWGDGNMFKLLSKASSKAEGWMKSTKAMEIEGVGCVVQVTTQQKGVDGTWSCAEAVTFVPGVKIKEFYSDKIEIGEFDTDISKNIIARKLIHF